MIGLTQFVSGDAGLRDALLPKLLSGAVRVRHRVVDNGRRGRNGLENDHA